MVCPDCHGRGWNSTPGDPPITVRGEEVFNPMIGCGTCQGFGVVHCCEGDSAMNENASKEAVNSKVAKDC